MVVPVVANVVALAGLLYFLASGQPSMVGPADWTPTMIWILAGSSTLSIALQALFLVIPLRRMGFRYRPVWGFRGVGLGSAGKVAVFVAEGTGVLVSNRKFARAVDVPTRQTASTLMVTSWPGEPGA